MKIHTKGCKKCGKEFNSLYLDQVNQFLYSHERYCRGTKVEGGKQTKTNAETPNTQQKEVGK